MKKVLLVPIAVFVLILLVSFDIASAGCGMCRGGAVKKGEIINATCPVMGGEVDKNTPYKIEYKGKTVGFCCAGCVEKFKADPEKYMTKLEKKCVIKCPKCGSKIDIMKECKKAKMNNTCPVLN
jgi:YHS domain-containing protein